MADSVPGGELGLPAEVGRPALRGLASAGFTTLEQLTTVSEADLLRLHGVGPKAIVRLRAALAAAGLSFAGPDPRQT